MQSRAAHRLERPLDWSASLLFGSAAGCSVYLLLRGVVDPALVYGCAAGMLGCWLSGRVLQRFGARGEGFELPVFELRPIEFNQPELLLSETVAGELVLTEVVGRGELLLTDADRLDPSIAPPSDELLVLDDILAAIDPDSRVVRLFDRRAMPTPAQLSSRIDGHLRGSAPLSQVPDASEALSEALAELRRSLR
jgi:hypothetical protein